MSISLINDLILLLTQIKLKGMRLTGHVPRTGGYRDLVGKPEEKRLLGRPRRRWENNIQKDFQEVDVRAWTGSSRFKLGTGGGYLWMR